MWAKASCWHMYVHMYVYKPTLYVTCIYVHKYVYCSTTCCYIFLLNTLLFANPRFCELEQCELLKLGKGSRKRLRYDQYTYIHMFIQFGHILLWHPEQVLWPRFGRFAITIRIISRSTRLLILVLRPPPLPSFSGRFKTL